VKRIAVLAGGVGAARFLAGLTRAIDPRRLVVIGNTADDETFFGLHVSPDLDTLTYTLAGLAPRRRGWGLAGDTFSCLRGLERFYPTTWFRLGDRDLATNLFRTERLRAGEPLSAVTAAIARRCGVRTTLLPMTDDRVRTFVHTPRGRLPFQTYLVRHRGRGAVRRIEFAGIRRARPHRDVLRALREAAMVIVPPSNPVVSIGPILALAGVREALRRGRAPVAAVSPIVGGRPIKGPADRMLRAMGVEVSAAGVFDLYRDFVDVFVIDRVDAGLAPRIAAAGCRPIVTDTLMTSPARAAALARRVLGALTDVQRRPRDRRDAHGATALDDRPRLDSARAAARGRPGVQ
jgi:LPPG:FO 2-phospho-L-lactate transferase